MTKNKPKAIYWINQYFLSPEIKSGYTNLLEERFNQLGIKL